MQAGLQHHQAGRLAEAERLYRQVLSSFPENADALQLMGLIARRTGRLDDAGKLIRRAIQISPMSPHFLANLGLVLIDQSEFDQAIEIYTRAIALQPNFAEAHCNLGTALRHKGRLPEAIIAFQKAVDLQPTFSRAYSNLSLALSELKHFEPAIAALQRAIEIEPMSCDLHYNLGNLLMKTERLDLAMAEFHQALALNPRHLASLSDLGNALRSQGNRLQDPVLQRQSIDCYEKAVAIDPEFPDAHWNLALTWLLHGDFARGWAEHEWRLKIPSLSRPSAFDQPAWKGEPLKGRTILLHPEQGLGDTMQFVRYVPLVAARGGRVILQCQPELHRLLSDMHGVDQTIARGQPLPDFDLHSPLMSLPWVFQTELNSVPADIPYVHVAENLKEKWSSILGFNDHRMRVGLVWAGTRTHKNDHHRSIRLSQLWPILSLKQISLISLQKGDADAAARENGLVDYSDELHDFADTAALIANLDLVISVDTAVAHLAGAMGKPVWVLLPHDPDWRWLLNRDDSPWYPSMKLFRQSSHGDWNSVIERVAQSLV